ncbi:MAG: Hsp20/alpha crystallin family protein [Pseudomonas sp.]
MYETLLNFPGSPFAEFERLQRELQQAFANVGLPGSIRAVASGAFPAINVGSTPTSIEIYAFAPGLDPAKLDVQVDHGLLSIAGERTSVRPKDSETLSVYANERFAGSFKRTLSLPEDADPDRVEARYRHGVLHIKVARRESAQPKHIAVQ